MATARSRLGESTAAPPLVCVLFAHSWSPPAKFAAIELERLRTSGAVNFAQLFVVKAEAEAKACWEFG